MRRDDLEDALHASFDHDHLGVYADELMRISDPRGELISLDLRSDLEGDTEEIKSRRRELVLQLLGPVASVHPLVRCRYGFVDLMFPFRDELRLGSLAAFEAALSGPLGRYVRDVSLYGDSQRLRDLMGSLALHQRPFLTRLSLESPHSLHFVDLPRDIAERAVQMMPRLEKLESNGRRTIPMVEFPTVREVVSHCYDAVVPLCANGTPRPYFPLVESVNLRLSWSLQQEQIEALLPPSQLPLLKELDVSRCTDPVGSHAGEDVFRFLRGIKLAPQVERLRVPAVDHLEQAANLQAAIDRMPALVDLGIVGKYPLRATPLRHRRATIRPVS